MTSPARLAPDAAKKLRDTARIVGWGLALYAGLGLVNAYLGQNPTGSLAVQAVVAELGAGRLAVAWSDPHGPIPTVRDIAWRAGKGAAMGFLTCAIVIGFAWATHAATFAPGPPALMMLPTGLIIAGFLAMRDELLLRGIVLRAFEHSASTAVALLVCALAASAAKVGAVLANPEGAPLAPLILQAVVAGLLGLAFAALWKRDRGAWLAWGAHTAWLWATGSLAHGGLLDVRWTQGGWGGGDAGIEGSAAAAVVLAGAAVAALFAWRGGGSRRGAPSASIRANGSGT